MLATVLLRLADPQSGYEFSGSTKLSKSDRKEQTVLLRTLIEKGYKQNNFNLFNLFTLLPCPGLLRNIAAMLQSRYTVHG